MRGSTTETANLLTKIGCSAALNEPTEEKAYAKLAEILTELEKKGVREIFTDVTVPKFTVVTLSNGNTIQIRWLHDGVE